MPCLVAVCGPSRDCTEEDKAIGVAGLLVVVLADQRVEQVHDLLLTGCCGVELAAYLGEPVVGPPPEVGQVVAHGVEAGRGGLAEVPDLPADLSDVAVSSAGQYAGGCGVLLAVSDALGQLADLGFQHGYARLQVVGLSHW